MSTKEFINDLKENYSKVRKLLDEESKNDPENVPYFSKYRAKEILINMLNSIETFVNSDTDIKKLDLDSILGCVLLNLGIIDMETEDLTSSERVLSRAETLLSPNGAEPAIVITLLNVYNNLGILWSNRDEPFKGKEYLLKGKELYETFKYTLQMPLQVPIYVSEDDDFMLLEKAHTLTLYYLAQVYGSLKDNVKSAVYCHITLRRQIQYNDYESIDWALNAATLSQYFAEKNGFFQSRNHLAAASTILDKYEETLREMESDNEVYLAKLETYKHRSADVARCWAKYCLLLMTASKDRLMDDFESVTDMSNLKLEDDDISDFDFKTLIFPDFDVAKYENKITDKFLLTFEDARVVFLCCQNWLNKAKEYYKLETLASDYIELVQDSSQSYSYLAFFEEDDERRAKMHKRRITMLEDLLKEINPTYYMQYCRQLWYELGEIYADIRDIKLEKINKDTERPTPQSLKKINMLCDKSIENYECFIESVKDKNGKMPEKLEHDLIKPVISAYAFIGRNSMKRIALDKNIQIINVKKSIESYKTVVEICANDEDAALIMQKELSLCQEMVQILPLKIRTLENDLLK